MPFYDIDICVINGNLKLPGIACLLTSPLGLWSVNMFPPRISVVTSTFIFPTNMNTFSFLLLSEGICNFTDFAGQITGESILRAYIGRDDLAFISCLYTCNLVVKILLTMQVRRRV